MELKIYQDHEKIAETGNIDNDYRILFPQTVSEAVIYKNDFTNENNLKSSLDYIIDNKSCVIVSEDEPVNTVGDTHWMKIIGTYNDGIIGNIYLAYTLKHIKNNHDGSNNVESENVICKANTEITPMVKKYTGYLAETPEKIIITENGQIVECYYDEQQYTISYVLNNSINSKNNPSSIYYTEEFTLENSTKEHYNFNGWYLDSNYNTKITKLNKVADNLTLYAKFTPIEYGITYVLNGGTNSSSNPNTITYFDVVTLSDATREKDTFEGWYSEDTFINEVITLSNITSDITLYAKFNHTHNYVKNITKEPTCTDKGITTYTCSCGDIYTEEMNSKGHNYVDGICINCGESENSSGGGETDNIPSNAVYLYNHGTTSTMVGDWVLDNPTEGIVRENIDNLYFYIPKGVFEYHVGMRSSNLIDFSSYSKIGFLYDYSGASNTHRDFDQREYPIFIRVTKEINSNGGNFFPFSVRGNEIKQIQTISTHNGVIDKNKYFHINIIPFHDENVNTSELETTFRIYAIWLEP